MHEQRPFVRSFARGEFVDAGTCLLRRYDSDAIVSQVFHELKEQNESDL
jgi:hypothetical protein